jgi:hypothetical protein
LVVALQQFRQHGRTDESGCTNEGDLHVRSPIKLNKEFARLRGVRLCGSAQSVRSHTTHNGCVVTTRLSHALTMVTNHGFVRTEKVRRKPQEMCMWDVIVIGSGIGGLAAAAALSKRRKRCLLLEQHSVAGGQTQTFERQGWTFATGVNESS